MPAKVKRPPGRKKAILAAACHLFAERGYTGVGMDEIGATVGITGSALYRHFRGKEMILVTLIEEVLDEVEHVADAARAESTGPEDLLDRLLRFHIELVIANRELHQVWKLELRHLGPAEGTRLRRRARAYMDVWCTAVSDLRPDLDADEVRFCVYVVMPLLHATADERAHIGPDASTRHAIEMAKSALLRPVPAEGHVARGQKRQGVRRSPKS